MMGRQNHDRGGRQAGIALLDVRDVERGSAKALAYGKDFARARTHPGAVWLEWYPDVKPRRGAALQVEGRDLAERRDGRHFAEYPGLCKASRVRGIATVPRLKNAA